MINLRNTLYIHNNPNSNSNNINFLGVRSKCNLPAEILKAMSSSNAKARADYFQNLSDNSGIIYKSLNNDEVVNTVQAVIDGLSKNKVDSNSFKSAISFLYSGLFPDTGVAKYIKKGSFERKFKHFACDDEQTSNMLQDIIGIGHIKKQLKPEVYRGFKRQVIDITSKSEYPINLLSNFAETNFYLDGVNIKSIEGFLQSLKVPDKEMQRKICQLDGLRAKGIGKKLNKQRNFDFKHLYWNGQRIDRESDQYVELLARVYGARYHQDENFRFALSYTEDNILSHSLGEKDPKRTLLTENEFVSILNSLRNLIK